MKIEGIGSVILGGVILGFSASLGYMLANKLIKPKKCSCESASSEFIQGVPRETAGWRNDSGSMLYKYND